MHDGMPYGRNQGEGQGHSREVDRQSPTGLIFTFFLCSTQWRREGGGGSVETAAISSGHTRGPV